MACLLQKVHLPRLVFLFECFFFYNINFLLYQNISLVFFGFWFFFDFGNLEADYFLKLIVTVVNLCH